MLFRTVRSINELKHQGLAEKDILKILNEKKAMLVYSPEEGEMRVDYSSIDSIKHYLKILHPADELLWNHNPGK